MINRRVVILAAAALLLLVVIATTQLSSPPRPQTVVVVRNATPTTPPATPAQAAITPPCQGVKIETPKLTVCGVIQYDGNVIWAKEGWVKGVYSITGDTSTCVFDTTPGVYVKFACQTPVGIIVK